MSSVNTVAHKPHEHNHEGQRVASLSPEQRLRRAVMSCMLWEDEFYEDGMTIVNRITQLIPLVKPERVAAIAVEARSKMHLRHMPLFIVREMVRHSSHRPYVRATLATIIQRVDEMPEFLAIYFKDGDRKQGKQKLAHQVARGLADAFPRFSEYDLAKYDRDGVFKLRDVLFLSHAKPKDKAQEAVWKKLIDGKLDIPDTWEVNLSAGKDKKATFERLLEQEKLGGLAFLRNLRNMVDAGVNTDLIKARFQGNFDRVLPFRFVAAARHAISLEPQIEKAMLRCLEGLPRLSGRTALIVDTSPSMWQSKISAKSEMDRFDAAAALAILARGLCEEIRVWTFNDRAYEIPARQGFALRDAMSSTRNGYSRGGLAVAAANTAGYDRIIVLTDGQWHHPTDNNIFCNAGDTRVCPAPLTNKAYMINVASTRNGVGYGPWVAIDGWSERVLDYVRDSEAPVYAG